MTGMGFTLLTASVPARTNVYGAPDAPLALQSTAQTGSTKHRPDGLIGCGPEKLNAQRLSMVCAIFHGYVDFLVIVVLQVGACAGNTYLSDAFRALWVCRASNKLDVANPAWGAIPIGRTACRPIAEFGRDRRGRLRMEEQRQNQNGYLAASHGIAEE